MSRVLLVGYSLHSLFRWHSVHFASGVPCSRRVGSLRGELTARRLASSTNLSFVRRLAGIDNVVVFASNPLHRVLWTVRPVSTPSSSGRPARGFHLVRLPLWFCFSRRVIVYPIDSPLDRLMLLIVESSLRIPGRGQFRST
ncbi:hypothetical protein R1flu_002401 [Riccia fluitans]|uniref:Secreted protein n=1 Tax=Riccia fluitans TaxID=41844 RepID=A0ABD1Y646_9MARC